MDDKTRKSKMAKSVKNKIKYKIQELKIHSDRRGWFIEMLKANKTSREIKQISVASIKPGEVRGNHYHLNKTEWFLVIGGKAEYYLENLITKEKIRFKLNSKKPKVITVFPEIAHAVKNIDNKIIYFIEADSEIYNHEKPDANPYLVCE